MFMRSFSWCINTLIFCEVFVKTHLTVHDSSYGERRLVDDFATIHKDFIPNIKSTNIDNADLRLKLKFEPEFLDFKQRPLGVPHLEKVILFNVDQNNSIDMTSISGSTVHFHSSFFEDKKIPPLGNTTFNVVFLGREEGTIESNLFIHTTEGHFKYQVRGASIYSPYRLRPIIGIKLPKNASFSPVIYMHNPHTEPIQIIEVYSSGGDFHLELPSGELEGPKDMWEIQPFETKAIIRVRFHAKIEQNHTAYVRIKLNNTEEILVVPLEVEVSSTTGLFEPQGSVDFGIGGSLDSPKKIKLSMCNPMKKSIRVHSVFTSSKAIKISYENVKIPSDARSNRNCFLVADLTVDWRTAFETKDYSGKIIVKYKNGKSKTEIPYYITVLEGGLSYDPLITRYFINEDNENLFSRSVVITNDFRVPVMLSNVSLSSDAQNYFQVSSFKAVVIKPGEKVRAFALKLKSSANLANIKLNTHIFLKTNVSVVQIPLLSYDGKLQLHLPFKSKDNLFNLGLISINSKKDVHFVVLNNNPININLKNVKSLIPMSYSEVIGCYKGNYTLALYQNLFINTTNCTNLKTNEYAVIKLSVHSSNVEGKVSGNVLIETQYEKISVPIIFKVAQGKFEIGPDRLVFDQCFPGKICSHPLRVHSTFNEPMVIENIISTSFDPRLSTNYISNISGKTSKVVGHLYLDPNVACGNTCYSGLQHDTTAQWLKMLSLEKTVAEFDLNLVNIFYNRYLNETSNGLKKWQNLTLRLDTSAIKGHLFQTRVKMSWPSILTDQTIDNKSVYSFPLTQIGNITYQNITIRNPSSYNLIVQLVLDKNYPDFDFVFEGLPPSFIPKPINKQAKLKHNFFFHESYKHLDNFNNLIDINVHKESLPVLLTPGKNFTFCVGYHAEDSILSSALIFIRNNLTILEIIRLNAQGAYPSFKFGNRKPGNLQPLSFDITEKHLKDCEPEKQHSNTLNLILKRTFTARNTGDVSIFIHNFYINDLPCEGYGFKVLNCEPFVLLPNASRKIDIAFTPDFTLAKITRKLILETSLNFSVNYTLIVSIPSYYLPYCTTLVQRPLWEAYLFYITVCLMCFLLCFVILTQVMESERIIKQALGSMTSRNSLSTQTTLDLRLIGNQTKLEMKLQNNESDENKQVNKDSSKSIDQKRNSDGNKEPFKEKDKYPAVIPTTGKAKKKLVKKNSNECNENNDKKWVEMQKITKSKSMDAVKTSDNDTNKRVPVCAKNKENKKTISNKKKSNVKMVEIRYEEETSSTTTESSSNNEEVEKESEHKTIKTFTKKLSSKKNSSCENLHLLDTSVGSPGFCNKIEHKKLLSNKTKLKEGCHKDMCELKPTKQHRGSRHLKEKREKLGLSKKQSNERLSNKLSGESICNSSHSPTLQISPSITPNMWGENRATFSDVVASAAKPQSSKPTMYVEPYKQTSSELGPIGPKKVEFWSAESLSAPQESQYNQISNSLFSDAHNLALENSNSFLYLNSNETWEHQHNNSSTLMNFMHPNFCPTQHHSNMSSVQQDVWNHNSSVSSPFWEENNVCGTRDDMQAQSLSSHSPGYWWGSSSVWQPMSQEVSRTPTRTPPGFTRNREIDECLQHQPQNLMYNTFGINDIWTQQQSNTWNYHPQGQ